MNIAVVGSNRGIGLALCQQLIKEEHQVYAFCRKSSDELHQAGPTKIIENFEVTDSKSMTQALQKNELPKIDRLYHVSGILESTHLETFDVESLQRQFMVNSVAPILSVKAFLPFLSEGAKIGLLTSRMGSIADNGSGGSYGYRMSKAALNAAGKSLALDLKEQGLAVFLLHPGWVKTDMTGQTGHVDTTESAQGLIQIMESKSLEETGSFWHMNGEQLPW
jgi:NAD(P)-dependent dehydrogenase (short-subunit alcohol dehydrogenase family)